MIDTDNPLTLKCRIAQLERQRNEWQDEADLKRAALASTSRALVKMADERDALRAELAAAKAHNIRLIEAINRLHEVAQGMWSGSESEIADIVNSAVEDES